MFKMTQKKPLVCPCCTHPSFLITRFRSSIILSKLISVTEDRSAYAICTVVDKSYMLKQENELQIIALLILHTHRP